MKSMEQKQLTRKQYLRKLNALKLREKRIKAMREQVRKDWVTYAKKPYPIGTIGLIKYNDGTPKQYGDSLLIVKITAYTYDYINEDITPILTQMSKTMTETKNNYVCRYDEHFEVDNDAVNRQIYLWNMKR